MSTQEMSLVKVPPQNIEAEQSVIGSVLLDNTTLFYVQELVSPDDFYKDSHKLIMRAVFDMYEKGETVDIITLTDHLYKNKLLEKTGGGSYLSYIVNSVPTSANVRSHSKLVKEKSLLRNMIKISADLAAKGYDEEQDINLLLDDAERSIFSLSLKHSNQSFANIKDVLKDTFDLIEKLYETEGRVTGLATGFIDLDKKTSGLQNGDLIIVAGRPSMGKTAFCLNIAKNIAVDPSKTVAVFSLEMPKEQLVMRLLCSEAKIESNRIRTGYLSRSDWKPLTEAASKLSEYKLFIDDTSSIGIFELRSKARKLMSEHGLSLIIIDYLQLMQSRRNLQSREQEIAEISRSLKGLAKELNIPVIALSQLSRSVESRESKEPRLSDLRESGAIEQDADIVMFIYRESVYKESEENKNRAEIVIGKHRNGPTGKVYLRFDREYTRFDNLEAHEYPPEYYE